MRSITLLLLAMTAGAYGLEGFREGVGDSWRTPDKGEHFIAGVLVGSVTDLVLEKADPQMPRWEKLAISIGVTAIVGTLKEIADHQDPANHDCSLKDGAATVLGGAMGAVLIDFTVHF